MDIGSMTDFVRIYVPNLLAALAVLLVGWLLALIVSAVARAGLRKAGFGDRMARWVGEGEETKPSDVERWVTKGVYYFIMLFVLVAFFQLLGLTLIAEPLNRFLVQVFQYAPRIVGAAFLLLIAWGLASLLKVVIIRVLSAAKVDERLGSEAGLTEGAPISRTIGTAVYWLFFVLFLPAVLSTLELEGLLVPVQGMIDKILGFAPNILGAGVILLVGWFVARIAQRVISNLLVAVGVDRLSEQVGLAAVLGKQRLSYLLGLLAYIFILIPVVISALNALALEAITQPASNMLDMILTTIPVVFAAFLVLAIAYVVARLVSGLVTNLLTAAGFNSILANLGLKQEVVAGERTPSEIVGRLTLIVIMLFASIEAAHLLGFAMLAELVNQFTVFIGHLIAGLVVVAVGLYLANVASKMIKSSPIPHSPVLAVAARVSILVLAGAMALQQMGLASDLINIAFGLTLGAIMVAAAIAFGFGGRDIAAREMERWLESLREKK